MKVVIGAIVFIITGLWFFGFAYQDKGAQKFIGANPTSYIFDINLTELKKIIIKLFKEDHDFRFNHHLPLPLINKYDGTIFFLKYRDDPYDQNFKNMDKNYFIIEPAFFWNSDIYVFDRLNKKPAIMTGKFLIKLEYIGINMTEISVEPILFEAKTFSFIQSIHGMVPIAHNVKPTGIEEYSFIYYIGCYIGIRMPEIKRPDYYSFVNNYFKCN